MKRPFQSLAILLLFLIIGTAFQACTSAQEEADKKLEQEINQDQEVAPEETVEVLEEDERVSLELDEELNDEIDKQINDGDIDNELEQLVDDAEKSDAQMDGEMEEDENEDPLK